MYNIFLLMFRRNNDFLIVNDEFVPVGLIGITDIISTIADYFSREIINLPPLGRQVDSDQPEGG